MKKIITIAGMTALFAASASAADVTVAIGESGTQVGAGASNTAKDGLAAEATNLWGVSNKADVAGLYYFTYSDLAGVTLPSTITAGTYTFAARIGNGSVFDFSGLNDITAGTNTDPGNVAGFFTTLDGSGTGAGAAAQLNANNSKNNMYTEFNSISGVTYTQPTQAAPADLGWTTWIFEWTVAEGSSVLGSNPYFGVYTKTGGDGTNASVLGAGFWDNSTLSFTAVPEPSTYAMLAGLLALTSVMVRRRRA